MYDENNIVNIMKRARDYIHTNHSPFSSLLVKGLISSVIAKTSDIVDIFR